MPAEIVPENAESMLDDLAERMKIIIEDDEDPEGLMAEIMVCAEGGGLHNEAWCVRTSSPWVFALDLIHDNPQAHDWMQGTLTFSQIRLEGVIDRNSLLNVLVRLA